MIDIEKIPLGKRLLFVIYIYIYIYIYIISFLDSKSNILFAAHHKNMYMFVLYLIQKVYKHCTKRVDWM